jgi:hypothetical protein
MHLIPAAELCHGVFMENITQDILQTPSDRQDFIGCLHDNLDAVVDGLRAIEFECSLVGDSAAGAFVRGLAAAIEAFTETHLPSARIVRATGILPLRDMTPD